VGQVGNLRPIGNRPNAAIATEPPPLEWTFQLLTIRTIQMRTLTEASMPAEIEVMMRKLFPHHCEILGPDESLQTVSQRDITGPRVEFENPQLPAYVALEFALGTGFSTNPEFLWAREILNDLSLPSEPRMQALRSQALYTRETRRSPRSHRGH